MKSGLTPRKVKALVNHIYDLPTLPTTIAKLLELIDNPRSTAYQVGQMISEDQVLTAHVLKLANSAYYGFSRRIKTIPLAIVVLGYETLKNVLLTVSIIDRFSRQPNGLRFDFSLFWDHTLATAVASKVLARDVGYQLTGEAFVAGLLHDLGKLILSQYLPEEFSKIYRLSFQNREPMYNMEKRMLKGVTHAEVGAWLAEHWHLPGSLVQAIRYHHEPAKAPVESSLAALVHIGDYFARKYKIGFSGDVSFPVLSKDIWKKMSLNSSGALDLTDLSAYEKYFSQKLEGESRLFEALRVENWGVVRHSETQTMAVEMI
ncbi:MAG: HDOD domain-containing protein [Calditrichaeota bacterium]|nr:HDOD domain-containing protein [Calditrichota bacterium]